MGTIAAALNDAEQGARFRLPAFVWRSIMLGVLMSLFSGPVTLYLVTAASLSDVGLPLVPDAPDLPSTDSDSIPLGLAVGWFLVAAPVLESLVFPPLYWLARRLPLRRTLFIAVVGVLALWAHGGTVSNAAQAMGFMLMAAWYAHLADRFPSPRLLSPRKIPYYGIVLAHLAWNATAILKVVAMGWYLSA